MASCSVCQADVPPEAQVRFVRWILCETHADLAIHASKHVTDAVSELGIDVDTQGALAQAGTGIWQAYRAISSIANRGP
jgi:hypothetical protein